MNNLIIEKINKAADALVEASEAQNRDGEHCFLDYEQEEMVRIAADLYAITCLDLWELASNPPENDGDVLGTDGKNTDLCHYSKRSGFTPETFDPEYFGKVFLWMHVPEPPK